MHIFKFVRQSFKSSYCVSKRFKQDMKVQNIFDSKLKIAQQNFAAASENSDVYDYVKKEFGFRLSDRVFDIKRCFGNVLELGCGKGWASRHLDSESCQSILSVDASEEMMKKLKLSEDLGIGRHQKLVMDPVEVGFQFKPDTFDCVLSPMSLHWVNDIPKLLMGVRSVLKNDGVFIGCMFCSDTLFELRTALYLAEMNSRGGISPRISPFIKPEDMSHLLNAAKFNLITCDHDSMQIGYPSIYELMADLKGMGEQNCLLKRNLNLTKSIIADADKIYKEKFGEDDGSITATFNVIFWIGWKPDPSQKAPLPRGSAQLSLKDISKMSPDNVTEK